MNFIDYKGTADWLACILKGIADRLIHDLIEQTKLLECFQEYEGCLSEAITMYVECTEYQKNYW